MQPHVCSPSRQPPDGAALGSVDAQGRITQEQIAALAPVSYAYDSRGLFSTITAGSGATSRTTSLVYNGAHDLTGISDALGRTINFAYDHSRTACHPDAARWPGDWLCL